MPPRPSPRSAPGRPRRPRRWRGRGSPLSRRTVPVSVITGSMPSAVIRPPDREDRDVVLRLPGPEPDHRVHHAVGDPLGSGARELGQGLVQAPLAELVRIPAFVGHPVRVQDERVAQAEVDGAVDQHRVVEHPDDRAGAPHDLGGAVRAQHQGQRMASAAHGRARHVTGWSQAHGAGRAEALVVRLREDRLVERLEDRAWGVPRSSRRS